MATEPSTSVYSYDAEAITDPWKVYQVDGPPYLNDLDVLEFGRGYWISVTQAITIHMSEAPEVTVSGSSLPASPPDTFYGLVQGDATFTPTVGMLVDVRIGSALCGQGLVESYNGDTVYVVDVFADDGLANPGCGQPGRRITFYVDGQLMAPTATWDNSQLNNLTLSPKSRWDIYLPLVLRQY